MGRFSPQVLPDAGPSFAENLANALGQGFQSYQGFKAKRQADEDRERTRGLQDDELALQGIMPEGWTPPPETLDPGSFVEQQPQRPDYVPFDEVMTGPPDETGAFGVDPQDPATMPHQQPRSASGHPGGWDPVSRTFARVPPRLPPPITLPSGRVYDQGGQMQRRVAQAMMQKEAELEAGRASRGEESATRYQQLRGLIGQPGYEKLTEAIARAAAEDPAAYREIVGGNPGRGWQPGSMAERLALHGAEAEQSAAAGARHRAPRAATDPKKQLMTRLQDVVSGAIALEKKDGVTEPTDQNAAARALNIIGADPELRPLFDSGKITRDLVWQAVQRYRDSRTLRGKEDEDASWMEDPAPKTSSGRPAANATRPLPAPDDVLDELDQEYGGDEAKIRTELKRRGFDPDA